MNSKVSFFDYNYLKENFKKSKGVMFLFLFVIPIFTYLFMLLQNNANGPATLMTFPSLVHLSIPAIICMYIAPFVIAMSLFSYLFKKDSVDFVNTLPLKRSTIYITNIIGGLAYFFIIFLLTSLIMFFGSVFFENLVIPKMMYVHFFITFFIAYTYTFLASCFTLAITGSKMVHVALTLIVLFVPGYISDFYNSRVYDNQIFGYQYGTCDRYDTNCHIYEVNNSFSVAKAYRLTNGQTLPYKFINIVPRSLFAMNSNEIAYRSEVDSVYNAKSVVKMIILSIMYFALGLYAYNRRKMEIAETTFKNENVHQLVKCLTLFPICLASLTLFAESKEIITILIMGTITLTIYIVYDLITHRNSGKLVTSVIYFLGLVLVTMLIFIGFEGIGNWEAKKVIQKDDVASIGIAPNIQFDQGASVDDFSVLKYGITNEAIMKLIFDNANKMITFNDALSKEFAISLNLKNGLTHYYNMRLTNTVYNELLALLDKDAEYAKVFKDIPYNKIYGVQLGGIYQDKDVSNKIVNLIKEGYQNKKVSDIVNATYLNPNDDTGYGFRYNLMNRLYVYEGGIKIYNVSTMINSKLINYVIQTRNNHYIENIKNRNVNINQINISIEFPPDDESSMAYYQFVQNNQGRVYRYINDNIKNNMDFSKYDVDEIVYITIYPRSLYYGNNETYNVYLPKDEAYEKLFEGIDLTDVDNLKGQI